MSINSKNQEIFEKLVNNKTHTNHKFFSFAIRKNSVEYKWNIIGGRKRGKT